MPFNMMAKQSSRKWVHMARATAARVLLKLKAHRGGYFGQALPVIGSIAILGGVFLKINIGFDFSDEGFYLNWIASPRLYDSSTTQFGMIYHGLYQILFGNLILLRIANVWLTYLLAVGFVSVLVYTTFNEHRPSWYDIAPIAMGLATLSLSIFNFWLLTPAYNSLAFQGLLVVAIGLVMAMEPPGYRFHRLGAITIALGGWMTLMAKPTTAGCLAIIVPIALAAAGRLPWRSFAAMAGTATLLFVVSAIAIDGTPWGFVQRLQRGLEMQSAAKAGYDLVEIVSRLSWIVLTGREENFLITLSAIIAVVAVCSLAPPPWARMQLPMLLPLFAAVVFVAIVPVAPFISQFLPIADRRHLGVLAVALFIGAVVVFLASAAMAGHHGGLRRKDLSLTAIVACLPFAYAVGTNNDIWAIASQACVFWSVAGVPLMRGAANASPGLRFMLPFALAAELLTAILLQQAYIYPYRQAALQLQSTEVRIGAAGARVKLLDSAATYIENARGVAIAAGLPSGATILDMTGESPGLLFALGATSLGYPWLAGGYPGSNAVAMYGIEREGCARATAAWILTEDEGGRVLSPSVVRHFGADMNIDYIEVGSWKTGGGASGRSGDKVQRLLKPVNSDGAAERCRSTLPSHAR